MNSHAAAQHKQRAVQHRPNVIDGVKQYARSLGENGLRQSIAPLSMIEDFGGDWLLQARDHARWYAIYERMMKGFTRTSSFGPLVTS